MERKFIIRQMMSGDIPQIAELEADVFTSQRWTYDMLSVELDNPNAYFIVCESGGVLPGYMGSHIICEVMYIANLAVRCEHRRRGVATALLEDAIQISHKRKVDIITLEVRESNDSAISLYRKFGFQEKGIRKNFYSNPAENGIIMSLVI